MLQLSKSIARAAWRNDRALASRLLRARPAAADHLAFNADGAALVHPPSFQELPRRIQSEAAEQAKAALASRRASAGDSRQHRFVLRGIERKVRLWPPVGKRLALSGIVSAERGAAADPVDRAEVLGEFWAPVFPRGPKEIA